VAHAGIREHGPAYWKIVASCARWMKLRSEHFRKRNDRTFIAIPLDCPVQVEAF
jgi:hypothetical protein